MLVVSLLFFFLIRRSCEDCLLSQEKRQKIFELEHNNVVRIFAHFSKQQCYSYSHMMRITESGAECGAFNCSSPPSYRSYSKSQGGFGTQKFNWTLRTGSA